MCFMFITLYTYENVYVKKPDSIRFVNVGNMAKIINSKWIYIQELACQFPEDMKVGEIVEKYFVFE